MYEKSKKAVYLLNYHAVWCTKYRRKVLVSSIIDRTKEIIQQVASDLKIDIISLEVMDDHVHLFVGANPELSPHILVKRMKGRTSNILRKEYPDLLKIPTLWTRSYYIGSAGYITSSVIQSYVDSQKGK